MVGVAQIEPKIVVKNYGDSLSLPFMIMDYKEFLVDYLGMENSFLNISNLGWYLRCSNSRLYSDFPQDFRDKKTKLKQIKEEIKIIMNMEKGTLKFIVDNEDKGELYENIPINEPLVPAILLYDKNDSVKIIPC